MKVVVFIFLTILLTLSACGNQADIVLEGYEGTDEVEGIGGEAETEEIGEIEEIEEEIIELIEDLRRREIRVATGWPYLALDEIRRLEAEFNITLQELQISYDELMPALYTSVMAGSPFADMVLLGGNMVFNAITDDLIYAVEEFQVGGSDLAANAFLGFHWTLAAYDMNIDGTFLGVNLDIIREINARNPVNLYENGEWTFQKFEDIMQLALGEGYFGISGVPGDIISHFIAGHGGVMVDDFIYAYDHPNTVAALEFSHLAIREFWQSSHGVHDWRGNVFAFLEGRSVFFPLNDWILFEADAPFEFAVIPFPVVPFAADGEGNDGEGSDGEGNGGGGNEEGYSFMRGFKTGMSVPRWTPRAEDVYAVFRRVVALREQDQQDQQTWQDRETWQTHQTRQIWQTWQEAFPTRQDALRAMDILNNQGRFDVGMAIPTFDWMHDILAEGFYNGSMTVTAGVERFRHPQQAIINESLEGWINLSYFD